MSWSHVQMACFSAYTSLFDVTILTGFLRLKGFTELHIAAYGSIIGVASFFGIFGAWIAQKTGKYKSTVRLLYATGSLFTLFAVLIGAFGGGGGFVRIIMLSFLGVYQISLYMATPVQLSWFHGIVGKDRWSGFFSTRFIVMDISALIVVIAAGAVIGDAQSVNRFLIVLCVGAALGFSGAYVLGKLPSLEITAKVPNAKSYFKLLVSTMRNRDFKNLLAVAFLRSFAYGLIVPFQTLFLLEDLGFGYSTISLLISFGTVMSMFSYKLWAYFNKKHGFFTSLTWNFLLSVFDPLLWVFATRNSSFPVFIAVALYGISGHRGVVNAGFFTSLMGAILDSASEQQKPIYNSLYYIFNGIAVMLAPIIAGVVLQRYNGAPLFVGGLLKEGLNGFRLVFLAAGLILVVTTIYAFKVRSVKSNA